MFTILWDVKEHKEHELSKRENVKNRMDVEVPMGTSRRSIGRMKMNERYEVLKKLYPYSIIYMENKREKYISYGMDRRIVNTFGDKGINKIYINNLEIEKEETYENNRYLSCYLRVKLLEVLSYYRRKKQRKDGKYAKEKDYRYFVNCRNTYVHKYFSN